MQVLTSPELGLVYFRRRRVSGKAPAYLDGVDLATGALPTWQLSRERRVSLFLCIIRSLHVEAAASVWWLASRFADLQILLCHRSIVLRRILAKCRVQVLVVLRHRLLLLSIDARDVRGVSGFRLLRGLISGGLSALQPLLSSGETLFGVVVLGQGSDGRWCVWHAWNWWFWS